MRNRYERLLHICHQMLENRFIDLVYMNRMCVSTPCGGPKYAVYGNIEDLIKVEQHRLNLIEQYGSEDLKVEKHMYGVAVL